MHAPRRFLLRRRVRWKPLSFAITLRKAAPMLFIRRWRLFKITTAVSATLWEPDVRSPASSVLATTTALQKLRTLHTPAQHPLAANAIAWLFAAYDPALHSWPLVPPAVEDAPHVRWWNQAGLAERFGSFQINPRGFGIFL